jgi:hypothetical protein
MEYRQRIGPGGTDYRPKGNPQRVNVHDFEDKKRGKVVPYGVYDMTANAGFVSVGIHSALMLRARITLAHFSVSSAMNCQSRQASLEAQWHQGRQGAPSVWDRRRRH